MAAQALGFVDAATGAIVPPVHPSTTYERDADNRLLGGRLYSRADNPSYDQVEAVITALEGGAASAVFASGMGAATAVFLALRPGDHVLVPRVIYWALRGWLFDWAEAWGLRIEEVDMTRPSVVAAAVRPGHTKLIWTETRSRRRPTRRSPLPTSRRWPGSPARPGPRSPSTRRSPPLSTRSR